MTELECGICYLNTNLLKTNCDHIFCSKCLKQWQEIKNNCPLCRCTIRYTNKIIKENNKMVCLEKRVTRSMTKIKREESFYYKFKDLAFEISNETNYAMQQQKINEIVKLSMQNYKVMPLTIYELIIEVLDTHEYHIRDRNIIKSRLMELKPYINYNPSIDI